MKLSTAPIITFLQLVSVDGFSKEIINNCPKASWRLRNSDESNFIKDNRLALVRNDYESYHKRKYKPFNRKIFWNENDEGERAGVQMDERSPFYCRDFDT